MSVRAIATTLVRTDGDTQMRAGGTNPNIVKEYAEILREAWAEAEAKTPEGENVLDYFESPFPPIRLFKEGKDYWLSKGYHRLAAHKEANIPVVLSEVTDGTLQDAIECALGANATHGLRRTLADKQRAVAYALTHEPWASRSNREIADTCKVSHTMVNAMRAKMNSAGDAQESESKPAREKQATKSSEAKDRSTEPFEPEDLFPDNNSTPELPSPVAQVSAASPNSHDPLPDLTEDEWLETLAIYQALASKQHKGVLFRDDALAYRQLIVRGAISQFKHHASRCIDLKAGGPTPLTRILTEVALLPPIEKWHLCSHCRGAGCHRCKDTGYNIHTGISPEELLKKEG